MKWLFLLLLIINLGIFAWGFQHEQMRKNMSIVAGSDVGDMRLLNEVQPESEPSEPTPELEPEVATLEAEAEIATMLTPITAEEVTYTSATELPEKPETPVEIAADTQPESQQQKETETESVIEAEPQVDTGLVVAAAEAEEEQTTFVDTETEKQAGPQAETKPIVDAEPAPKEQPATVDVETEKPVLERPVADGKSAPAKPEITSRCGSIGPLKDRKLAREIVQELEKSKFKAKVERNVEKQQIGFWVVIPPMTDGSQAQAKIDELAKAGLKDIWHFRGGGLKNAISLGMFSKKENAENFSRKVLKKGFKTKMQPRYLNKTSYLVKFSIKKPKIVTRLMWRMVENKYSKHEFSEQTCEPIATR